jgi:hypothetical protein
MFSSTLSSEIIVEIEVVLAGCSGYLFYVTNVVYHLPLPFCSTLVLPANRAMLIQ